MTGGAKSALTLVLCASASYLLWIVLTGTFALHELLLGILAALLATLGLGTVNLKYPARFRPTLGELLAFWRLSWYLLSGAGEVWLVAARDLVGGKPANSIFRLAEFEAGEQEDPHCTARRVLATAYTTVAPNFIVLGVNSRERKLLFHQIERSAVPKMTKGLGAKS